MTSEELYKKLKKIKGEWSTGQAMRAIGYPCSRQRFHTQVTELVKIKLIKKIHYRAYISC